MSTGLASEHKSADHFHRAYSLVRRADNVVPVRAIKDPGAQAALRLALAATHDLREACMEALRLVQQDDAAARTVRDCSLLFAGGTAREGASREQREQFEKFSDFVSSVLCADAFMRIDHPTGDERGYFKNAGTVLASLNEEVAEELHGSARETLALFISRAKDGTAFVDALEQNLAHTLVGILAAAGHDPAAALLRSRLLESLPLETQFRLLAQAMSRQADPAYERTMLWLHTKAPIHPDLLDFDAEVNDRLCHALGENPKLRDEMRRRAHEWHGLSFAVRQDLGDDIFMWMRRVIGRPDDTLVFPADMQQGGGHIRKLPEERVPGEADRSLVFLNRGVFTNFVLFFAVMYHEYFGHGNQLAYIIKGLEDPAWRSAHDTPHRLVHEGHAHYVKHEANQPFYFAQNYEQQAMLSVAFANRLLLQAFSPQELQAMWLEAAHDYFSELQKGGHIEFSYAFRALSRISTFKEGLEKGTLEPDQWKSFSLDMVRDIDKLKLKLFPENGFGEVELGKVMFMGRFLRLSLAHLAASACGEDANPRTFTARYQPQLTAGL